MKKRVILLVLSMIIFLTGCSFKENKQIDNLKDAYVYLSEISANKEEVSIDDIKEKLKKFKIKYKDTQEIALFNAKDIEKIEEYEIDDPNYNISLNINNNRITKVNISNKDKTTQLEYSGYEELIYLEENVKRLNEMYLTSKIENIDEFENISKALDKSLESELFSKFNELILMINNKRTPNIKEIENIIGFQYNDNKLNKESYELVYRFSDSKYEINAVYSKAYILDSIYMSHDIGNEKSKIGLAINYNISENNIDISIRDRKEKSKLLKLNNDFVSTFINPIK